MRISDPEKGLFPIGTVADIIGVSQKKLRVYETNGLVLPARSEGNRRLYSKRDVERLTLVHYLVSVRRVNLAGAKVVLEMLDIMPARMRRLFIVSIESEIASMTAADRQAFEARTPSGRHDAEAPQILNIQRSKTNECE
ncbi:MAG: MerR family transcriptional regulator [Candidatus Lernaella stagnicola]|nr:MerR family transcriptional regulator [Candidatus Lernaella stagnicola]